MIQTVGVTCERGPLQHRGMAITSSASTDRWLSDVFVYLSDDGMKHL